MNDRRSDPSDDLLRALPRYAAPPSLRAAIAAATAPRPQRPLWLAPALSAVATALVLLLFVIPLLPRSVPADPVQRYVRAVVSEHARTLMWGARHSEIAPAALPWLTQESGIALPRFFAGDDRLTLVAAEPVYLERQRGVALHYRDVDGHMVSYIALPAAHLTVPDRQRVQIDRFRPALLRDSGFATLVWKHGDVACFLVSDMVSESDLRRFKTYFLSLRASTEPVRAY